MIIKKFVAPTMAEALAKVKNDLGEQAVILKTRLSRQPSGTTSHADRSVEVTAAVEPGQRPMTKESPPEVAKKRIAKPLDQENSLPVLPSELLREISQQVSRVAEKLEQKSNQDSVPTFFGNLPAALLDVGRVLVNNNLSEDLAIELLLELARTTNVFELSRDDVRLRLKELLTAKIPQAEPVKLVAGGCTVVMFVGGTGSGKTSAVARVAMQHKLEKYVPLAIVTADNFRADSGDQIKAFCRILGCPCAIVRSPEELSLAIRSCEQGLLLVDTPGVSFRDANEVSELVALVRAARPHEVHLVVPAGISAKDMRHMLGAFADFAIDKILITKLDETRSPGGVISGLIKAAKRPSYVSSSREIPGRFSLATAEGLAEAVLEEATHESPKVDWETEVVGLWQ